VGTFNGTYDPRGLLAMLRYRKLHAGDAERFAEHIIRLDLDDRRSRFGATVSDDEVRRYCAALDWRSVTVIAFFDNTGIRAAGELRMDQYPGPTWGEAAFSVEKSVQGQGIGRDLMRRIVTIAQNAGLARLSVICRPENRRMRQLLTAFNAESTVDIEEVVASIRLHRPNPLSLVQESLDDSSGLMPMLIDQWYSHINALMTLPAFTLPKAA